MNNLPTEIEEVIKAEAIKNCQGIYDDENGPAAHHNRKGYESGAKKWALGMQAAFRKAYSLGYEAGQIENGYHSDECWMAFISECRKIKQK